MKIGIIISFVWLAGVVFLMNAHTSHWKEIINNEFNAGYSLGIRVGIERYKPATDTIKTGLCNCLLVKTGYRDYKTGDFVETGLDWEIIELDSLK